MKKYLNYKLSNVAWWIVVAIMALEALAILTMCTDIYEVMMVICISAVLVLSICGFDIANTIEKAHTRDNRNHN